MYFSADSLSSTDANIGGLHFVGGNSNPVGTYLAKNYKVNADGLFLVELNYAQAVNCRSIQEASFMTAPKAPPGYLHSWKV